MGLGHEYGFNKSSLFLCLKRRLLPVIISGEKTLKPWNESVEKKK
jgi:hypothetical protein